jgi:putative tributyrin esterase
MLKNLHRIAFPVLLFSLCFGVACSRKTCKATVVAVSSTEGAIVSDVHFYSPEISDSFSYRIILPTGRGVEKFPVLYLLHGANSDPAEVTERSEVVKLAAAEHIAVVIPDGKFSYYANAKHKPHAKWGDATTQDLRQDVLARFPVLAGREHTGIAGVSMGGYGAANLTLKHPDLYGFTGIMSGALDITRRQPSFRRFWQTWRIWTIFGVRRSARNDEDVFNLLSNSNGLRQTGWFVSCGERDPLHGTNERFVREMRQHGVTLTLVTTKSGHDWTSWNEAMPQMFRSAGQALR